VLGISVLSGCLKKHVFSCCNIRVKLLLLRNNYRLCRASYGVKGTQDGNCAVIAQASSVEFEEDFFVTSDDNDCAGVAKPEAFLLLDIQNVFEWDDQLGE